MSIMYWTDRISDGPKMLSKLSVSIGTNIFVFGSELGSQRSSYVLVNLIYVFDTVNMKWFNLRLPEDQDKTCIPVMFLISPSIVAHNSKIYLWGGQPRRHIYNSLYCFDTKTIRWTQPEQYGVIPSPRLGHIACVIQDCMYISGGLDQDAITFYPTIKLNLKTMIWDIVETMGTSPSILPHSATVIGNKLYTFCDDFNVEENILREAMLYVLDTTSNQWIRPTYNGFSPPIRSFGHITFTQNGFLYVFNDIDDDHSDTDFEKLYRYDPITSTWMTIFPKGTPPNDTTRIMCTLVNNRIFITGGCGLSDIEEKYYNDLDVLDLDPNLYTISLVNAKKYIKEKRIKMDNLHLPLKIKRDLGVDIS